MEDGLNWGLIICIESILLIAILVVVFYGVYRHEVKELEEWKEKARNGNRISNADMESRRY